MDDEFKKVAQINGKDLGFTANAIRELVKGKTGAVFLYRIGGVVSDYFTGESKNGEWVGFRGQFIAMLTDGQKFQSSAAFFPAQVATRLREQLEQGVVEVEVTADIFAQYTDKNATGYAYMCEPIMSATGKQKLAAVKRLVMEDELPMSLGAPDDAPALAAPDDTGEGVEGATDAKAKASK